MSGTITTQINTDFEVSLDDGASFVPFPCVTSYDPGSASVPFTDTSCFSTPTNEPEFTAGRVTRSAGSIAYKASAAAVHQYMLANPGGSVQLRVGITFEDGGTYTRTQKFLIGGVSEPIEFDGEYVHTAEVQPSGAITRAFT